MITLRRILKNKELYVHEKTIEERRIKYQRTVVPIPSFLDKAISRDSRVIHGRKGSILHTADYVSIFTSDRKRLRLSINF
jgi:hypothetical protein